MASINLHNNMLPIISRYCNVLNVSFYLWQFTLKVNLWHQNFQLKQVFLYRLCLYKSQRPSVFPFVCPSIRKESPLTATIFHLSLPNLYSIFISLKNFEICSFIKKWEKLLLCQPFFFLSFNAYLPMWQNTKLLLSP